jgi:AhpD family alkylhydroperoxidase
MQISLPSDGELSAEALAHLRTAPPLNVFRMVARTPASLSPFIQLARAVLLGGRVDAKLRELAVLRVAHVAGSRYVFQQHLALAKMVGVTEDQVAAVVAPAVTALDAAGNLVCRVADEITRDVRLSDEALAAAVARFGEGDATELILCCSYFNMVSRFLESTRVPVDLLGGRS